MKKLILTTITAASVFTLGACSNESDSTLIESKAGDVTAQSVVKNLDDAQKAQLAFQDLIYKITKDKYEDKVNIKDVEKKVDENIKNFGGEDKFTQALQQQQPGLTIKKFKELQVQNAYRQQLIDDAIKISDEDVKENTRKASHILIATTDEMGKKIDDKKVKKEAEKILAELKKDPAKFAKIAKEKSSDKGTAEKGGELGYVNKGQMVPTFEEALFKLKEGEMSNLVKTPYGYHIILNEKMVNFEKDKDLITQQYKRTLMQKNKDSIVKKYKSLLKEYDVQFKDKDLEKAVNKQIESTLG